jgi:dethiobiotin synthase
MTRKHIPHRGIFITGTDTGVGKTHLCRQLASLLSSGCARVTYMKPVQTGCPRTAAGSLVAPDFEYVKRAHSIVVTSYDVHVPYRFRPACSPHLASRVARRPIRLRRIRTAFHALSALADYTIVEGAGGVLAPISESRTMLDIMRLLGLPVVLVASPRLGTLNHTLLSAFAVGAADLALAAIVVNSRRRFPRDAVYRENIAFLRRRLSPIPVIECGYCKSPSPSLKAFCHALIA